MKSATDALDCKINIIVNMTGGVFSREEILDLISANPDLETDQIIDKLYLISHEMDENIDFTEIKEDENFLDENMELSKVTTLNEDQMPDIDENIESKVGTPNEQPEFENSPSENMSENVIIAKKVTEFFANMFPFEKMLGIVENHPNKYFVKDVVVTALEEVLTRAKSSLQQGW